MKKIINHILHRLKEDSLSKKSGGKERIMEYKNLKEMKSGLVFWTVASEQQQWLKAIAEKFPGIKFDKLCFVPDETEIPVAADIVTFRKEELGFGGKIQNEYLHALLDKEYDLLIDLTTAPGALINYVLTNTRAHCITGWKKGGGIADIVVEGGNEPLSFINELSILLAEIKKC